MLFFKCGIKDKESTRSYFLILWYKCLRKIEIWNLFRKKREQSDFESVYTILDLNISLLQRWNQSYPIIKNFLPQFMVLYFVLLKHLFNKTIRNIWRILSILSPRTYSKNHSAMALSWYNSISSLSSNKSDSFSSLHCRWSSSLCYDSIFSSFIHWYRWSSGISNHLFY